MAARKKSTPFASDDQGRIYVKLHDVMHPLWAVADGLQLVFFGKETTAYLPIDVAIEWCKKEGESHDRDKYEKMVAVMERAKVEGAKV